MLVGWFGSLLALAVTWWPRSLLPAVVPVRSWPLPVATGGALLMISGFALSAGRGGRDGSIITRRG